MLFSRAIKKLKDGEVQEGLIDLREAYKLSSSEIKRYCEFSIHIQQLKQNIQELDQTLQNEIGCEFSTQSG